VDPVDRVSLAVVAASRIREAILQGRLALGSKLGEVELSQMLGVSRAPIREALQQLQQEGLVTSSRYRGTSVAELSEQDIEELATLRSALERLSWSRAATRLSPEDVADLTAIVGRMREAVDNEAYPELVRFDIDFHDRVVRAADHGRLYTAWSSIKWQAALLLLNRRVAVPDYHRIIVAEHAQLLNVLRAGNPERAADAVDMHIAEAYARLVTSQAGRPSHPAGQEDTAGENAEAM